MREVVLWTKDGAYIGEADDGELFGTNYPWFCGGAKRGAGTARTGALAAPSRIFRQFVKREETCPASGRVHDLLGQRISLLLRALRDNQQLAYETLFNGVFFHNLAAALREDQALDPAQRLNL